METPQTDSKKEGTRLRLCKISKTKTGGVTFDTSKEKGARMGIAEMSLSLNHNRKDCDDENDIRLAGSVRAQDGTEFVKYQCLNCGGHFVDVFQDDGKEDDYVRSFKVC